MLLQIHWEGCPDNMAEFMLESSGFHGDDIDAMERGCGFPDLHSGDSGRGAARH
jgi:hypothetical protein